MDIRDEFITGSFAIGHDGRKEPPTNDGWKAYAQQLEAEVIRLRGTQQLLFKQLESGHIVAKCYSPNCNRKAKIGSLYCRKHST